MRITILAALLTNCLCLSVLAEEPQVVELTIHARAVESPVLKYKLLPSQAELKPGNAATILLRLPWEETKYFSEVYPKLKEWDSRPMDDPAWKNFGGVMPFFEEMRRAAYRRDAVWEYPVGEEPAFLILLPDVQGLRTLLGYGLSAGIRNSLLHGELDEAREGILVGLANGRHIAQTPFFVNQLVAAAIHRAMLDRTADLIAQPDSPNLYWALSTLPASLVELGRAAGMEASMFSLTFPAANDLGRPRTAEEWKKMLTQLFELFDQFGDPGPRDSQKAEVRRAEFIQAARAELAAKVAAMSDDEAAVRWYVGLRAKLDQHATAAMCLQPRDAWPQFKEYDRQVEAAGKLCKTSKLSFFDPTSVYLSVWLLKQRVASLRIVEAVRDYLATHDGKLPATLADVSNLPIGNDPLTNEPFQWTVVSDTATLAAPALTVEPKANRHIEPQITYRLRVK